MLFRSFSLPGEVSFQNTIQKHDANFCTNSLFDRIERFTAAPSHFTDIRVQNGPYSEPSSLMAGTAKVYGSGRGCSEWGNGYTNPSLLVRGNEWGGLNRLSNGEDSYRC